MNINLIYRHPCELEIKLLLSREEPYSNTFTLTDRTIERLTRACTGLVHVMNEILPSVGGEQATVINNWLRKVTSLIDISLIDVESTKRPTSSSPKRSAASDRFGLFQGSDLKGSAQATETSQ